MSRQATPPYRSTISDDPYRSTISDSSVRQRDGELLDVAPDSDDVSTSPVGPEPLPDPDRDGEADDKQPFLGLSFPQLAGGSLAAVVSAVAASTLGVAGTLLGAALGSVIVTVTAAAVNHGLTTAGSTLKNRSQSLARQSGRVATATSSELGDSPSETVTTHRARRVLRLPRPQVWLAAAAVFAIAMIGLTLTEQVLGHPVSSSSSAGTTLGHVVNPPAETTPPESPAPMQTPAPTQPPVSTVTDQGTAQADVTAPLAPESPTTGTAAPTGTGTAPQQQPEVPNAAPDGQPADQGGAAGTAPAG